MRAWLLIGGVAAGCSFSGPSGPGDTEPPCDPVTLAFGEVCAGEELARTSVEETAVIDTATGESTGVDLPCVFATLGGREVCAAHLAELDIGADLRVIGDRPLVLIATGELRVRTEGAILSGSGDFGGVDAPGPGADPDDCAGAGAGAPGGVHPDSKMTYGGGGGGGFGSRGGDGGTGRSNQAASGPGGSMIATPMVLRGGCPGGDGGDALESGAGGSGGGALYLTSLSSQVRIDQGGRVDAAGGGGAGGGFAVGTSEGGGGGGGSGGMIVIEGSLSLAGTITAAGGGGGEGGEGDSDGELGNSGSSGRTDGAPAPGGEGAQGADGGDGATRTIEAGSGAANDDGGGGGGGGVGVILEL